MAWADIGWPVLAAAIAAFGVALFTRHAWAGLAGALLAAPLCLYLEDLPYLHWVSLSALPANFVSAALVWRGRRDIAFTFLLPFMIAIVLIAVLWTRDFSVFRGLRI